MNLLKENNTQTLAVCNCFQIQNKLIRAEKCVQTVKIEQIERIIELIGKELELLKAWKKSNKMIKQ